MSIDDQVSPASSVPAFGRILLKIPTSRLESFRIHFICNTELMDLGEAGWGRMADSLKPFLDASELLNRVTFVVEDRHIYGRGRFYSCCRDGRSAQISQIAVADRSL